MYSMNQADNVHSLQTTDIVEAESRQLLSAGKLSQVMETRWDDGEKVDT